jgi:5'-methylthioadenosine phosphorylase
MKRPRLLPSLVCFLASVSVLAAADTPPPKLTALADAPAARVAILGGTFLNDALFDSGLLKSKFRVPTAVGPSPEIHYGEHAGVPFYYIHAHGYPDFVATWLALHHLGVKEAIGGATAGGINVAMKTYDFVFPHDVIDFNSDRPKMLPYGSLKDKGFVLARLTPAVDPLIHRILLEETRAVIRPNRTLDEINIHERGVVLQAAGGRFESAAEILHFRQIGGDVVTMNVGTEISFARQAGINYACLIIVSNPAEGLGAWGWDSLPAVYKRLNPVGLEIVKRALIRVVKLPAEGRVGDSLRIHPEMTSH